MLSGSDGTLLLACISNLKMFRNVPGRYNLYSYRLFRNPQMNCSQRWSTSEPSLRSAWCGLLHRMRTACRDTGHSVPRNTCKYERRDTGMPPIRFPVLAITYILRSPTSVYLVCTVRMFPTKDADYWKFRPR